MRAERSLRTTSLGVGDVIIRIAAAMLVVSVAVWVAVSATVVVGRARYERRLRTGGRVLSSRQTERLFRRAERPTRTDWGRWRRISALTRLARMRHPVSPHLLQHAIADPDTEVSAAAVRSLGTFRDRWAIELLVRALRDGTGQRSRIATQLEHLPPDAAWLLLPLLHDEQPAVRFWGATLIAPHPGLGESDLIALTRDQDANVRAAAVEALGSRTGPQVAAATLALLDDPEWFVRVHAARSAAHVVGADAAESLAGLLGDRQWWVRTAAKDALRTIGSEAIPPLVAVLSSSDGFARNSAAEVLQDIGLVDHLALEDPEGPLLQRIYAAGGPRLQEAAESRRTRAPWPGEVRAA